MSETLRVLLIEDSATDAKLVLHELKKLGQPIESTRVQDPAGMEAALSSETWDLAICDWSMPKFDAPTALAMLREHALDLPFIIVSGTIGEEAAVEAMRAGAHDYVLKDRLGRLNAVVARELRESEERAARRRAELALRESEARFARLADSGIVGIAVADVHGNTIDANDEYLRLVGFSRDELMGGAVRWTDLTPPEWAASDVRASEELMATGKARPWEKEMFRKDGSRVPILIGVAMLEYPRVIVFIADLSAQRRAEHALRSSEEQLRQAQKMEAVGRLAGGVAHDFNNVLSVILSYSELLIGDLRPGDPIRDDIEEIRKAATRAASLTQQLLLFSRHQVVEPKVIDLNDCLRSMEGMLRRILGEDVDLQLGLRKEISCVRINPGHLEQVVMNLVVNARDAMPTGGKLTIETCNVAIDDEYALGHLPTAPGAYVMLAVTDTGIGMDKETQARVFEPFFTTKGKYKGTGLGLSTVFGIIQQSGGNVWVYSELGKGTTFKTYLPAIDTAPDVTVPQPQPTNLNGNETILMVEDEDQVRTIVLGVLRRHGYRVLPAQNAGEALLICEQHPGQIDLLLTDVVMPQMSGPELAKRLCVTRPQMKVLCMSGYTDDSAVRHGVLEPDVAFFQKPITPLSLARKVREVLDMTVAS
jgi:PAS domain S-box-containing protein